MSAPINSTQLPTTYPDGFPLIPLEAVNFSYFLSDAEKDDWRDWLVTATDDQKNELVDTLHSIWLDQQKQSLPQAFEANSPLPIIQTQPAQTQNSQFGNPSQSQQQFTNQPAFQPQQQFASQPQAFDFQSQNQPNQFNQPQSNFQPAPVQTNSFGQPQQFDFQSVPQNNFNNYPAQSPQQQLQNQPVFQPQPQQQFESQDQSFDFQPQPSFDQSQFNPLQPAPPQPTFTPEPLAEANFDPEFKPEVSAPAATPVAEEEDEDLNFDDFDFDDDEVEETPAKAETPTGDIADSKTVSMGQAKYEPSPLLDESLNFDETDENLLTSDSLVSSNNSVESDDLELNSNLSMGQTNPVLEKLYGDMQDKQKQLYEISGSLNDFQGQFLKQVIESMSLPAELESQLSKLNRDAITGSQRIQSLEDRTQTKPGGDSLQAQINQLRLQTEKNRRNLEYALELQAEEFKEFKSMVTTRLEDANKQITAALSNTYSESGILERIDKMAARLARIEIDLRKNQSQTQN